MHDLNGTLIQPGQYIVYAALWDRSAVLKYGFVVRIGTSKPAMYREPSEFVSAITVERGWKEGTWNLQKDGKPIALHFENRILVISAEQVPEEVKALLNSAGE